MRVLAHQRWDELDRWNATVWPTAACRNGGGFFLGKGLGFVGGNEVIMEVEKEDGGGIVEAKRAMSVDATTG